MPAPSRVKLNEGAEKRAPPEALWASGGEKGTPVTVGRVARRRMRAD